MALGILHSIAGAVEDADRVFTDIHNTADDLRSLAISIREDAFRRNSAWLRIHRPELIQQVRLLSGLIKDLELLKCERKRQ
jgi:hypothetical protein